MVASGKCDFNPGVAGPVQILFSLLAPLCWFLLLPFFLVGFVADSGAPFLMGFLVWCDLPYSPSTSPPRMMRFSY